jgi:hypothetical protein
MVVPFAHVGADERTDGLGAPRVDVAEQVALALTDVPKNVEYKSLWRNAIEVGVSSQAEFWTITRPSGRIFLSGVVSI